MLRAHCKVCALLTDNEAAQFCTLWQLSVDRSAHLRDLAHLGSVLRGMTMLGNLTHKVKDAFGVRVRVRACAHACACAVAISVFTTVY